MKNVLVFGANSFIAKAFISAYREQYHFIPVYRKSTTSSELVFDFSLPDNAEAFAEKIKTKIDGVIFAQGINPSQGVNEISLQHFQQMMQVNLYTPIMLLRCLREKLEMNAGIVFFSSVAKRKGSYDPSYAAAKAGVGGLIQTLANSFPSQRFNMITLGLVEGSPVYEGMTEDFREKHASRMQNRNFIKPESVCSVVDMLLNNININRADVAVDGGYQ